MADVTVVYYTANREKPAFEAKIRARLWQAKGDLPLISVSQQPLDFGTNICIGDVGVSSYNAWRQLQMGAEAATTPFVCTAESDCIYPPEYFACKPREHDVFYEAHPVWVLFAQRGKAKVFARKLPAGEFAIIAGRKLLIDRLHEILSGQYSFAAQAEKGKPALPWLMDNRDVKVERRVLSAPVLTIKTDANMHRRTPYDRSSKTDCLHPFGSAHQLLESLQ